MRIDIHSHLMSVAFLEHLQGRGTLPTAARDADGYVTHCAPLFSLHYRAPILDVEAKLQDMDAAGIDLAVLSPALPGPAMLGGPQADSWAARINDELAVITAACPTRFAGWASLGFGDPRRTIAEVDRSLDGSAWPASRSGPTSAAPARRPRRAACPGAHRRPGAAIHLHPTLPPGRQAIDAATMTGFGFPVDTSLAVLRLIGAGLFDRDPVIIAAHLGGVLPWLRDRLAIHGQASPPFPSQRRLARPMGEYLDRLYVDTVGYELAPLEYCYTQLGADRLLFGTDHPFAAPALPGQLIDRLPGTSAEREQILAGNAQRLLRLHAAALDMPGAAP